MPYRELEYKRKSKKQMTSFRTLGLIVVAITAGLVLFLAVYVLWNARELDSTPLRTPTMSDLDLRAQVLLDHVELLSKRVADMQTLVLILLAASGLYTIVFVISAHFSALNFSKQADWYVTNIKDQLGLAMGDLRELKEETRQALRDESKAAASQIARIQEETRAAIQDLRAGLETDLPTVAGITQNLTAIQQRIIALSSADLDEEAKLEIGHYESAISVLEVTAGQYLGVGLARAHRAFAELYARRDLARTRFHLRRALSLTPAESVAASEIQYELACVFATLGDKKPAERTRHFEQALEALRVAFRHPSRSLDDKLAEDIEEGGCLYRLASTRPFDRAINDLLLNMSVGAG
jgi:hypothetical protein